MVKPPALGCNPSILSLLPLSLIQLLEANSQSNKVGRGGERVKKKKRKGGPKFRLENKPLTLKLRSKVTEKHIDKRDLRMLNN